MRDAASAACRKAGRALRSKRAGGCAPARLLASSREDARYDEKTARVRTDASSRDAPADESGARRMIHVASDTAGNCRFLRAYRRTSLPPVLYVALRDLVPTIEKKSFTSQTRIIFHVRSTKSARRAFIFRRKDVAFDKSFVK